MKRLPACLFIIVYLGALFYGIACHAVGYKVASHPAMYFVVWDMFCGWAAYENRQVIIAEGRSGQYYQLTPAPWGEYHPYGNLGRQHYDSFGNFAGSIAANCLKHTQHEPIRRVFCVEQSWSKKFNLPDELWKRWYENPKDLQVYNHVRSVWTPEGEPIQQNGSWFAVQEMLAVTDNPRLRTDSRKGQPFYAINPGSRYDEGTAPSNMINTTAHLVPALRVGNAN